MSSLPRASSSCSSTIATRPSSSGSAEIAAEQVNEELMDGYANNRKVLAHSNGQTLRKDQVELLKVQETINDGVTVFKLPDSEQKSELVGGDRDEHGCIGSAGYQWCERLGECVRPWELDTGDVEFAAYCKPD